MVVVEYQHQLCRKRPHPVVHHDRIMDVELHTVIDIVERVVEIDDRLRRELCRQTHVAATGKRILRLFEQDGVTILRVSGKQVDVVREKTAYVRTLRRDALGDTLDVERQGYGRLPLIPLYANQEGKSELTPAIQAKIDAYDNILSDFADNLARANDVYWVLNNFSGTTEDIAEMLEEISRIKAVANLSDGSGSGATAEPHTIEVPYAARQAALNLLERALYNDYMALDLSLIHI